VSKLTAESEKLKKSGRLNNKTSSIFVKRETESNEKHDQLVAEVHENEDDENEEVEVMDTDEQQQLKQALTAKELKHKLRINRIRTAKYELALGHFYLLIYDYVASLNAYRRFLALNVNKLKVSPLTSTFEIS
jgi:hypothetical protein